MTLFLTWTGFSCCVWPELPPRSLTPLISPADTPSLRTPDELLRDRGRLHLPVYRRPPLSPVIQLNVLIVKDQINWTPLAS